jgi:phospholipase/carboxylesterase
MKIIRYEAAGLQCVELAPDRSAPEIPLVVSLHGMGDWGETSAYFAPLLNTQAYRFVFPTGPRRAPVGLFSWFDLDFQGFGLGNLAPKVAQTLPVICELIDQLRQRYQLPANRVALGGFSLGAMLALETGLAYPEKLGGLFSLSGFLVADNAFNFLNPLDLSSYYKQERGDLRLKLSRAARQGLPVLVAHGIFDFMIPFQAGLSYYNQLETAGIPAEFYPFWGGHYLTIDEFWKLNSFLSQVFSKPVPAATLV